MKKNPGLAAVLSLVVPGVGQIYNGAFLRGIFWLIITPGFWIGTGGWLGWVCHLISAYTAYNFAERLNRGARPTGLDARVDGEIERSLDSLGLSSRTRL